MHHMMSKLEWPTWNITADTAPANSIGMNRWSSLIIGGVQNVTRETRCSCHGGINRSNAASDKVTEDVNLSSILVLVEMIDLKSIKE